jgi:hypothetical protein
MVCELSALQGCVTRDSMAPVVVRMAVAGPPRPSWYLGTPLRIPQGRRRQGSRWVPCMVVPCGAAWWCCAVLCVVVVCVWCVCCSVLVWRPYSHGTHVCALTTAYPWCAPLYAPVGRPQGRPLCGEALCRYPLGTPVPGTVWTYVPGTWYHVHGSAQGSEESTSDHCALTPIATSPTWTPVVVSAQRARRDVRKPASWERRVFAFSLRGS